MRTTLLLVALMAALVPVAATAQTPVAEFACDRSEMIRYRDDIYYGNQPRMSQEHRESAFQAWEGLPAWRDMDRKELSAAIVFYDAWAFNLSSVPESDVPDELRELHTLRIRNIELMSDKVGAYRANDREAYDPIAEEGVSVQIRIFEIESAGLAQCGDMWRSVFGEPWHPETED